MSIITPYYYYNRYDIISTYDICSIINTPYYQTKTLISFWRRHEFDLHIFCLTTENLPIELTIIHQNFYFSKPN